MPCQNRRLKSVYPKGRTPINEPIFGGVDTPGLMPACAGGIGDITVLADHARQCSRHGSYPQDDLEADCELCYTYDIVF